MMLICVAISLLTGFGVFLIPFFFAPTHPALSASYTAGFNNRVAVVFAALAALLTFLLTWRYEVFPPSSAKKDRNPIALPALFANMAVCTVFTSFLGGILTRAQVAYNDNLYFLEYMDQVTTYHLHIYKDFSFLYGPALLYFPLAVQAVLRPLHIGLQGSYYVALTLMQLLGIVLLYFTLGALPLSKKIRTTTLCLFTICVLCPLLGLNYTLVRSLLPFSTLLFASRARSPLPLACLFFFGEALQLSVSPELGVAFAAGACFFAACRALREGPVFIPAILAPLLAVAAFIAMIGKAYLTSIAKFSSGCLNLVVEPLPYILIFLFALVWLVPRMLARAIKRREHDALLMSSLFVVCLALLPAAFGRCDPLHVFFNGAGLYLLAAVAINPFNEVARRLWFIGFEVMLVSMQAVNFALYLPEIIRAATADIASFSQPSASDLPPEIIRFEKIIGKSKVSIPFRVPYTIESEFKRAGQYQPDPECFYIGIWDQTSETARIERMRTTRYVLLYASDQSFVETTQNSRIVVGFGFTYPQRRQPYRYGALLYKELSTNWTPISESAGWILYRNNR